MKTLADRFRKWYDHERDANAKIVAMLASVPEAKQADPAFQKAVARAAHLVAARRRWLNRLGKLDETMPPQFPTAVPLADLAAMFADTEALWVEYLGEVDDAELARTFDWTAPDGKRYRWDVEGVLTQVHGHAWYHRGQIAQLVAGLGGNAVDTDYFFFCKLTPLEGE